MRRLRAVVESPSDAWLAVRMGAWALALPLLKRVMQLERLASLMWTDQGVKAVDEDVLKIAELSRLLARRRPPQAYDRCYERSLLAYRFLSQRGADPRLVVALRSDNAKGFSGHAWVTVDDVAVGEPHPVDDYVPLVVFGRGGRREP